MKKVLFSILGAFVLMAVTAPIASATSGPGCLRVVNVANWDTLNMRSRPTHRSRIVDRLHPRRHGIIRLDGACGPSWKKWAKRWCPVTHYNGNRTTRGYVKARFVRDNECP